jgi:hypothetical protein
VSAYETHEIYGGELYQVKNNFAASGGGITAMDDCNFLMFERVLDPHCQDAIL